MRQKKRRPHISPLQFILYSLAVASALFNIRLGKELLLQNARAVRAELAVTAYRNNLEELTTTLHGRVTSAYHCKLKPEYQNSFDQHLQEGTLLSTASLSKHIRLSKNRPFR